MLLLLNPEILSTRFNSLLRNCKKNIDPKYSPARLQRHLIGLEKTGLIKREKKGDYYTTISVTFPKNLIELENSTLKKELARFKNLRLWHLIELKMKFYRFLFIEQTKADLERFSGKTTTPEHEQKLTFLKLLAEAKLAEFDQAMLNRSKPEYEEALKTLKNLKGLDP